MSYTVTVDTLPQFMMQMGFLLSTKGKVEYTITSEVDDEQLVQDWRLENPKWSDQIRSDLQQNPDRRSHLVTLT